MPRSSASFSQKKTTENSSPTWNLKMVVPGLLAIAAGVWIFVSPRLSHPIGTMTDRQLSSARYVGDSAKRVVVYMDTACSHCLTYLEKEAPTYEQGAHAGKFSLSYELVDVIGPSSRVGAMTVYCARHAGLSEERVHNALRSYALSISKVEGQGAGGALRPDQAAPVLARVFAEAGTPGGVPVLERCVSTPPSEVSAALQRVRSTFLDLNLKGTPSVMVDGIYRPEGMSSDLLK